MNSPPFGYLETFMNLSGDTLVSFSLVCFAKETLLSLGGKTGIWECVNAYWEVFVQGIRELYSFLSIWDQMSLFISDSDCMCIVSFIARKYSYDIFQYLGDITLLLWNIPLLWWNILITLWDCKNHYPNNKVIIR